MVGIYFQFSLELHCRLSDNGSKIFNRFSTGALASHSPIAGTPSYTNGAWKYIPAVSGDYRSAQTGIE